MKNYEFEIIDKATKKVLAEGSVNGADGAKDLFDNWVKPLALENGYESWTWNYKEIAKNRCGFMR